MNALVLVALAAAPVLSPPPTFTPPSPVVRTLASGARLWVVPQPGLPLVHVAACVNAGALQVAGTQSGLALLTAQAVEEGGAGDKTPAQVLATFDTQGVELHVGTDDVCTSFAFTALSSRVEPALRQLVEMLARPRFDAVAFESVKKRQLADISQSLDQPRALAHLELMKRLFSGTPAEHDALGEAAHVKALGLDDVKRFHAAHYASAGITFIMTGDVTAEAAQKLLDGIAPKAWLTAAANTTFPAASPTPGWYGVDRPGQAQTQLQVGKLGVLANDPARPERELAATVLGGAFTSRLNQNLREKHGYTYGASARVDAGRTYGYQMVGTAVRTDVTAEALRETFNELSSLKTLSADELAKAKALNQTNLVAGFSSGRATLGTFVQVLEAGLPPDDLTHAPSRAAAVTLDRATAAAATFDPAGTVVVLVGDRAVVEKQLAKVFPGQTVTWSSLP